MSREIEFRAWDKDSKQWVDDVLLTCNKYAFIYQNHNKCEFIGEDRNIELSQFTGILDNHGKKIFEGDICKQVFGKELTIGAVGIEATRGAVLSGHTPVWPHDIEIIGNLYENPDLLEQAK